MATEKSTAHPAHPSTEGQGYPHVCLDGVVYIGHLVDDDGNEVEVFETVTCRRCADEE